MLSIVGWQGDRVVDAIEGKIKDWDRIGRLEPPSSPDRRSFR